MSTDRVSTDGDRRVVAVATVSRLATQPAGSAPPTLWVLEQHDGRLWQIVAMASTAEGCQAFLDQSVDGPAVPAS